MREIAKKLEPAIPHKDNIIHTNKAIITQNKPLTIVILNKNKLTGLQVSGKLYVERILLSGIEGSFNKKKMLIEKCSGVRVIALLFLTLLKNYSSCMRI